MLKTVSSVANAIGALNYKGTWDAKNNTPTLTSGVGTKGDYYVVSVAGNTNLDGETLWGVGDWAVFNGTAWQKVDGGDTSVVTDLTVTTITGYMYANNTSPVTASLTIPNSGLANSTATLGNATITLGSTTSTVGNLTLNNVTINSGTVPNTAITSGSVTLGNTTVGLGNTATSVGNLTLQNTNITSVSSTFPNSFFANSTATLGNATITLGSTTTNVGNLTLANANISATTNASATFATSSLQLVPAGYIQILLNGSQVKIPYYSP